MKEHEKKMNDQLYTLNLTVVALVALVAIVGLTAIVLNGGVRAGSMNHESIMNQAENTAGHGYVLVKNPSLSTRHINSAQPLGSIISGRNNTNVSG